MILLLADIMALKYPESTLASVTYAIWNMCMLALWDIINSLLKNIIVYEQTKIQALFFISIFPIDYFSEYLK